MIQDLDRVILTRDYKFNGQLIAANTIATCRSMLGDESKLIQHNSSNGEPQYIGVPISHLRKATKEELESVKIPDNILPKIYHNGNRYSVKIGHDGQHKEITLMGTIIATRLAPNEMDDIVTILFDNESESDFNRRYLIADSAYIPVELPEFLEQRTEIANDLQNIKTPNNDELDMPVKEVVSTNDIIEEMLANTSVESIATEDQIFITIGEFKFTVVGKKLVMPNSIELNEFGKFQNTLLKLANILK